MQNDKAHIKKIEDELDAITLSVLQEHANKEKELKAKKKNAPKKRVNGAKKGKNYEREICTQIAHIFPKARRHLEFHALDAEKKMDIQGTLPWVFQCKRKIKYENPKTLLETIAEPGEIRVLITKADKLPDMAVLEWADFKCLLEIAHGLREPFKSVEQMQEEKEKLNISSFPPFNKNKLEELGL